MGELHIPECGDFDAWPMGHGACIAVDWDGTCRDTMVPKWTRGFNLAIPRIWPELAGHQQAIDEVCYRVNMVDPATAGVPRFVALKIMMGIWSDMGLPAPDLSAFARAVEAVEATGGSHGAATYRGLMAECGYDDSPLRWSDLSDEIIAESTRDAKVFDHCREALAAARQWADLIVVSAGKTESVRDDLIAEEMTDLFAALLAQDFLPKPGILRGLARRYSRVLFVGDTHQDVAAGAEASVTVLLVTPGREADVWARATALFRAFCHGDDAFEGVIPPA